MPTQADYARLATYIDTEGSLTIRVQRAKKREWAGTHYSYISVCNTDRRMIDWCKNVFGGFIIEQKEEYKHKAMYVWNSLGDVASLIRKCLPHMVIKAEQALIVLAIRRTFSTSKVKLTAERMAEREGCRLLLAEVKHNKRGYFEWSIPKEIEHLFYWRPDEIPDVRTYTA